MCLKELLATLKRENIKVNEDQIRYVIRSGNIARPELNMSLRFEFSPDNVAEIVAYFGSREVAHAS